MRRIHPFDESGIVRGADGIARYQHRPSSLVEMLRRTVEEAPDVEAIVELDGQRVTYRQLWDRASRVAGGLRAGGITRGDRVAIRLRNGLNWCLAFFGTQMAGAIAVPVNTRFTDAEAEYVVGDSGSAFVFHPDAPLPDRAGMAEEDLGQEDVAAIFYTSGTTGFPKGAMLSHQGFLSNIETCRRIGLLPFDGTARTLVSVPLFHVTGCNSLLLPTCEARGTTVIMPAFQIQAFLNAIEAERINVVLAVPSIYWLAINQSNFREFDTSSIRSLAYGGAPIAPDLVQRILEAFPRARVGNGFGLTETSAMATYLPHDYARVRPETVGFSAPVVDLKLEPPSSNGGVGELLVRGPNVVKGYWNKPEATAATFVDGWLHTGDLARIDEEGFVQICDRKKDMVNRGGEHVYCVEVEGVLSAHPAVFEAAVMGVKDDMMGERVAALVVLKPGRQVKVDELLDSVRGRLAEYKVPQYVVITGDLLPRNPGGKILKKTLRENVDWGTRVW